jgi:hypothetical protein
VDGDRLVERLRSVDEALERSAGEVESRLSRSLVLLENARDALRGELAGARRVVGGLLDDEASEAAADAVARTGAARD